MKLFFDGVIEYPTQTAAMIDPYKVNNGTAEDPHWVPGTSNGPTYFPPEIANPGMAALDAAGWQVHVHAIGDRAVRSALDAIEFARGQNGDLDNRHTLAHIEAIDSAEYKRFRQLNAMANMQMQWAERDSYTMKRLKPYIGPDRWHRLYAAGGLEAAGARLCGGSDWPVDPLLPFRQIEMAVNRTADEIYKGGDQPLNREQSISLRSSIAMHTRNSAYQLHQAGSTGAITRGRQADLVVLDRNLFDVKLTEVSTTKVMMTMVDGDIVHLKSVAGDLGRMKKARALTAFVALFAMATLSAPSSLVTPAAAGPAPIRLKVMTFNIQYGASLSTVDAVIKAIRRADADVVGIQEPYGTHHADRPDAGLVRIAEHAHGEPVPHRAARGKHGPGLAGRPDPRRHGGLPPAGRRRRGGDRADAHAVVARRDARDAEGRHARGGRGRRPRQGGLDRPAPGGHAPADHRGPADVLRG